MNCKKRMNVKSIAVLCLFVFMSSAGIFWSSVADASTDKREYRYWREVGVRAANRSMWMMRKVGIWPFPGSCIALTNAGYAEIKDRDTAGALDGITAVLNVGRGDHTLVEVHSSSISDLWFAVYHQKTGKLVYLQVNPDAIGSGDAMNDMDEANLFSIKAMERVDAAHLYENATEYAEKFNNKIFGGNEFRIVTIANAIAEGAPSAAVRSFEYHDHYCPGVTSGILMALFVKSNFPLVPGGSYFIQSVQAWCKEDALMTILNTTPGKGGYHVYYATQDDMATWLDEVKTASTIVYRFSPETGGWEGIVLGYQGGDTGCPGYGNSVIDKLCADLWYLKHLDHPEDFITVLHEFELAAGEVPKDFARPGADPMQMLGLTH